LSFFLPLERQDALAFAKFNGVCFRKINSQYRSGFPDLALAFEVEEARWRWVA